MIPEQPPEGYTPPPSQLGDESGWSIRQRAAAHCDESNCPRCGAPPDVWPSLMVWMERRQTEDPASLTFLDDRIGELDEAARPSRDEREALDERLKKALAPVSDADWIVVIDQLPQGGRRFFAAPRSASLTRVWPAVFREWQLARVPAIAARTVLEAFAKDADKQATNATAERELTTAIRDALPGLLAVVGEPPHTDAHTRAVEWLRARPLRKVKTYARKLAALEWTAAKWADPWNAALFIGEAWWTLKVRDELPAFARPGLPSDVLSNFAKVRALQGDAVRGQEQTKARGREIQSWTAATAGRPVVGLDVATIDASIVRPELLGGLAAQRLLRFVMHRSHTLYDETRDIEQSTRITVTKGWRGLATAMGMGSGEKAAQVAAATAKALQAAWVTTPLGEGGLFLVHHEKRHRDNPTEKVTLTIHEDGPLSPRYAARLLQGRRTKIVPVPLPELMPPMVGRPNEHGAIATLQLLVLRELRMKATELVELGGVVITAARWDALAKEAGVPAHLLTKLLEAWTEGRDGVRPFIVRRGELVDLAPDYEKERRFIVDGGQLSLTGHRKGLASQRKKRRG